MAILNFVVSSIGQSGDIPTFVYFDTNDTLAAVTTAGYLNKFVAQGNSLSDYNMALVSTLTAGVHGLALCSVVFSGGDWSLVQYNGNPFSDIVLVNSSGDTITFKAPNATFTDVVYTMAVPPLTAGYVLSTDSSGDLSWVPQGGGGSSGFNLGTGSTSVYFNTLGSVLQFNTFNAGTGVSLSTTSNTITVANTLPFDPAAAHTVSGPWTFSNASIEMTALANVTTNNVVYYNSSSGLFTYGAAPTGGLTWNNQSSATSIVAGNAYVANNGSTRVILTLPVTAAFGAEFEIVGNGAAGWAIAQNAGQNVQMGNVSSTVGVSGAVNSTNQYDCIKCVCTVANTTFVVRSSQGNPAFI